MSHKGSRERKKISKESFLSKTYEHKYVVEGMCTGRDGCLQCIDGWSVDAGNLTPGLVELRYQSAFD